MCSHFNLRGFRLLLSKSFWAANIYLGAGSSTHAETAAWVEPDAKESCQKGNFRCYKTDWGAAGSREPAGASLSGLRTLLTTKLPGVIHSSSLQSDINVHFTSCWDFLGFLQFCSQTSGLNIDPNLDLQVNSSVTRTGTSNFHNTAEKWAQTY